MNKKTTLYLFFVTVLALLLNLVFMLSVLNLAYLFELINIKIEWLIFSILFIAISGALISFVFSEMIARFMLGVTLIKEPSTYLEKWLFTSVERQSRQLGIIMPQIGVFYASDLNAFTTGWGQSSALFAVSSGLLEDLDEQELDAVIGHELAHIESGDMISLSLSQGLVVSITELPARLFGYVIDHLIFRRDSHGGVFYNFVYWLCMLLAGLLPHFIVMWFSRQREFSADDVSARLNGGEKMVAALRHLAMNKSHLTFPKQVTAWGMSGIILEGLVSGVSSVKNIFSSHPQLAERIEVLDKKLKQ